jgi:hypothetical protein
MSSRAYMAIIVLAALAGPAAADDSTDGDPTGGGGAVGQDDGFFTRIKILGSTTGQMQKDNATLSGGIGLSAENTRHFLYLLINSGLAEKPPATGAPSTSYGQFLLSPPTADLGLTLRYRYFLDDGDLTLGGYGQLDVGRGDLSATIAGAERTRQGVAIALDAGAVGKMVISRQRSIQLFLFTGLSSRFLGGDAARDDDLKRATLMTTQTAFFGVNGAQLIPVVGLRGGFDISTAAGKAQAASPVSPAVPSGTAAPAPAPAPRCVIL